MAVTIAGIAVLIFAVALMFFTEREKRADLKRLQEEAHDPFDAPTVGDVMVDAPVAGAPLYDTMQVIGRAQSGSKASPILTNKSIASYARQKMAEKQTA
jgi:Flp pilus assembly protein TadB